MRDRVLLAMQQRGIGCARYFAPIHLQPAYAALAAVQRPTLAVTESVAARTLALPFFNRLSPADAEEVVSVLKGAIAKILRRASTYENSARN